MRQAERSARSSTRRAPAKTGSTAAVKTRSQSTPAARPRPAKPEVRPVLTLAATGLRVRKNGVLPIAVAFTGLDEVRFELEPQRILRLDRATLDAPGEVRLLGRRDGKASLFATGLRQGVVVIERMIHLDCDGPVVRLLGFGYTPRA